MAVSGVLGKWNLSSIEINCRPPAEVYAGLSTLMKIELINHRRWLPGVLLQISYSDQTVLFPIVAARDKNQKLLEVIFQQRGIHPPPKLIVTSRFPINFFIRRKTFESQQTITVFPQPVVCKNIQQSALGNRWDEYRPRFKGQDGDISRISNYQGGEPLKRIHWKLSARQDQLKVKELSNNTQSPVILDINDLPGANLEMKLRHAAFLVIRLLKRGRPVGLQDGVIRISPNLGVHHKLLLLQALACYGQDQNPS